MVKYGDGEIPWYNPFKKTPPKKKHTHTSGQSIFPQKDDSNVHFPHPAMVSLPDDIRNDVAKKAIDHRWEKTAKSQWQ